MAAARCLGFVLPMTTARLELATSRPLRLTITNRKTTRTACLCALSLLRLCLSSPSSGAAAERCLQRILRHPVSCRSDGATARKSVKLPRSAHPLRQYRRAYADPGGTLYGVSDGIGAKTLLRIDPATGLATVSRRAEPNRRRHQWPTRSRHGGDLRRKTLAFVGHGLVLASRSEHRGSDVRRQSRREDHWPGCARKSDLWRGKPGQQQLLHHRHEHRRGNRRRRLWHVGLHHDDQSRLSMPAASCGPYSTMFRHRRVRIRSRMERSGDDHLGTGASPTPGRSPATPISRRTSTATCMVSPSSPATAAVAATSAPPTLSVASTGSAALLIGGIEGKSRETA